MEINKIYNEPCLDTLKRIPDNFLDCVITSPPYWQLRDYGYEGQWGLEPTYNEYLEHLWSMMDLIQFKLKPEGTCWINLGDTYSKTVNVNNNGQGKSNLNGGNGVNEWEKVKAHTREAIKNIKIEEANKCLLLIPHRFAIGCIERGWIMRNDCIWAKRNGMPESVTDRFSKKHEYFFFMVKSEKYYFDLDAVRDKHTSSTVERYKTGWNGYEGRGYTNGPQSHYGKFSNNVEAKEAALAAGKNPGSVADFWDVPTKPSSAEHYASYNDHLLKKPVLAGCPVGGIIYDPFMGTGSTAEVALRSDRKFIGSEMSKDYVQIAEKRLKPYLQQIQMF